ncbi:MAG TPA: hypothetical protein VGF94_07780 [Kofleriaceae bacterium]|jgi:hypothetical protein
MLKLAFFASIATIVGALTFATLSQADNPPPPCKHTDFHTQIAKDACAKGGQPEAKKAMQAWVKTVKIDGATPTCSAKFCHKNLAPNYDLNDTAYDKFKKAGGKMLK